MSPIPPESDPEDKDPENIQPLEKSKSQIKREIHEYFLLGEKLADLPLKHRRRLPLEGELQQELELIAGMAHREARRRQLRHFAKLLRASNIQPLQEVLADIELGHRHQTQRFHELESLRDLLLTDTAQGLAETMINFPQADRQHINQLVRNAKKEAREEKAPASSRKLFKYLRQMQED